VKNIVNEKKRIILVDDNPFHLRIGEKVLTEKYAVDTASSAEKMFRLLEHLKNNKPAMILLDIDMPAMNGYDALRILKSKQQTKDIPVVLFTSRSEMSDILEGLSLGAVGYIFKPFDPQFLLNRIEIHLLAEARRKEKSIPVKVE